MSHHAGQEARQIDAVRPGFFLVEREYGPGEVKPRLVRDREYLTASIYEEGSPDDGLVLVAEIDGKPVDPDNLWVMRLYEIGEAEYHRRRADG